MTTNFFTTEASVKINPAALDYQLRQLIQPWHMMSNPPDPIYRPPTVRVTVNNNEYEMNLLCSDTGWRERDLLYYVETKEFFLFARAVRRLYDDAKMDVAQKVLRLERDDTNLDDPVTRAKIRHSLSF